jgi:hypothetical protein
VDQSDATGVGAADSGRPEVLYSASATQVEELERQFEEQDREAWTALTRSYGWTEDESQAVWQWFSQRPGAQASS